MYYAIPLMLNKKSLGLYELSITDVEKLKINSNELFSWT